MKQVRDNVSKDAILAYISATDMREASENSHARLRHCKQLQWRESSKADMEANECDDVLFVMIAMIQRLKPTASFSAHYQSLCQLNEQVLADWELLTEMELNALATFHRKCSKYIHVLRSKKDLKVKALELIIDIKCKCGARDAHQATQPCREACCSDDDNGAIIAEHGRNRQ